MIDLVSGISLSETNYTKAIDLLHDRFENTQSLIAAHMDQLVTIPKVHDINDVMKLRTVYDRLESNIRNLTDLEVDATTYGTLLISIVFDRVPAELQIIISREFKDENWSLNNFMKLIKEELHARERCAAIRKSSDEHEPCNPLPSPLQFTVTNLQFQTKKGETQRGHVTKSRKCVYCSSNQHIPSRCTVVSDPKARLQIVRKDLVPYPPTYTPDHVPYPQHIPLVTSPTPNSYP